VNLSPAIKSFICLSAVVALAGCGKSSFQDSQLVGSWKLENPAADLRLTYYPNHTWVMIATSPDKSVPTGAEFGGWKLNGNQLLLVTSCGMDNQPVNNREVGTIVKLNDSVLVFANGATKNPTFHKSDAPTAAIPDKELAGKLVGSWMFSYTNVPRAMGVLLYSAYQPNGVAHWQGTIYQHAQSHPAPKASGTWLVQNGYMLTAITNSEPNQLGATKQSRDQILSVTDSQFTYKDEQGSIQKVLRRK
jgi:hypothetical protein